VRMTRSQAVVALTFALAAVRPAAAQQSNRWAAAKCDLKPGHYLVNSGLLYLKSATETKFEDQKQKDLQQARTVLTQAVTTGSQEKNPAAWYYLARYYVLTGDLAGADSAFTRAQTLKSDCKGDIDVWRRIVWVPTLNAGIAAWQGNNPDSAIKAFRRANAILQDEPQGFKYLASLLYQAGQIDSAAVYFRKTADVAARDTGYRQDRKDALFNLARIQHSQGHLAEAEATYREYLALYPNDSEALGSVASVLLQTGRRDSAIAIFQSIIAHSDSVGAVPLFRIGVEIYTSAPELPDTAAAGRTCRGQGTGTRQVALARARACRDSLGAVLRDRQAAAEGTYRLAAQAFDAGLKLSPYHRDGLFNLANTYLALNDSASMLPVAQRLFSVDPLNRASVRLLAFAHQRVGHIDSTLHYLRLADSTLTVDVTVTAFDPGSQDATVKGTITNLRPTPTQPFKLVFELLNAKGDVVATQSTDVSPMPPQESRPFELKAMGAGVVAWRYHKE
jgi:tetratricopeptide (TPR) repeat protein